MLWFIKSLESIESVIYSYFGIDFSSFTDFEKVISLICANILVVLTFYVVFRVIYTILCKFFSLF